MQQALAFGVSRSWVTRQVAKGIWQRIFPGIFVTDSARISWFSRAQAAVFLGGFGSYLSHESAWFLNRMQTHGPRIITVSTPSTRYIKPRAGVKFFRRADNPVVHGQIPHTREEDTLLDLLANTTDSTEMVGLLTVGLRARINPNQILQKLGERPRFPRRRLILELLGEASHGVESPLEFLYDRDVESAHGLPKARKQLSQKIGGRWIRADRVYEKYLVRVELDGQLAHPGGRTNTDTWRDNAVLLQQGEITLRYRWLHIMKQSCEVAVQVAAALRNRGWKGALKPCGPGCTAVAAALD